MAYLSNVGGTMSMGGTKEQVGEKVLIKSLRYGGGVTDLIGQDRCENVPVVLFVKKNG